jgi:hypothetical protein
MDTTAPNLIWWLVSMQTIFMKVADLAENFGDNQMV